MQAFTQNNKQAKRTFKRIAALCLSAALLCLTPLAAVQAKVKLIANTDDDISLSRQEVRSLFLGGAVRYNLNAVALTPNHKTRLQFNTHVLGLTESRIQSYWAQMRFSGKSKPPMELSSEEEVLAFVINNEGAVAYVDDELTIPSDLKVVYQSD